MDAMPATPRQSSAARSIHLISISHTRKTGIFALQDEIKP